MNQHLVILNSSGLDPDEKSRVLKEIENAKTFIKKHLVFDCSEFTQNRIMDKMLVAAMPIFLKRSKKDEEISN